MTIIDICYAMIPLVGFAAGFILGNRHRKATESQQETFTCGCGHGFHEHNDQGCKAQIDRKMYNSQGEHTGREWVRCTCVKYTGTIPLNPETLLPTGFLHAAPRTER